MRVQTWLTAAVAATVVLLCELAGALHVQAQSFPLSGTVRSAAEAPSWKAFW